MKPQQRRPGEVEARAAVGGDELVERPRRAALGQSVKSTSVQGSPRLGAATNCTGRARPSWWKLARRSGVPVAAAPRVGRAQAVDVERAAQVELSCAV